MNRFHTTSGLFLLLLIVLGWGSSERNDLTPSLEGEKRAPARPLAIVRRFRPMVQIRDTGNVEWVEAKVAYQLFDKDTLRTEREGYAVLQLIDNSLARVRPNSVLVIRGEPNARNGLNSRIQVESGEVNLRVEGRVSQYEVSTPSAVAAVKGTEFTTRILEDGSSEFTVFSGVVEVTANASGRTQSLTRRRRAVVDPAGNEIVTNTMSNQEVRRTQTEYTQLDTSAKPKVVRIRFVNAAGQVQEIEIQYFEKQPQP
jgi:hypothetical protein